VRRRSNTRERLLAAAVDLIDERGVDQLRMIDVAERVGVTEPSIYKSFTNKDALIVAASIVRYERGLLELFTAFVDRVDAARSREEFRTALRDILRTALNDERAVVRATRLSALGLALERPALAKAIVTAQRKADAVLEKGLERAAAKGWVRTDVPAVTLGFFAYTVVNGRHLIELDPERTHAADWDRLAIDAVIASFEHGLDPMTERRTDAD
jgi:AcrR family transcriptional regulator